MSHIWDSLVLGGTDKPRFLSLQKNFCSDPYIQNDLNPANNWYFSSVGILSKVLDKDAYGDYMARINYSSDNQYIYYVYNHESDVSGKKAFITLRYKSDNDFKISFISPGSGEDGLTKLAASNVIKKVTIIASLYNIFGNFLYFKIYGSDGIGDANVYFDSIYFSLVDNDYSFPQPQTSELDFNKIVDGSNQRYTGRIQEINKKWLPIYNANWDYINAEYEVYRQIISESEVVFCIPHKDVSWGFLGYWDDDFIRGYAFNRFIGHKGIIAIRGMEYIYNKPQLQSGDQVIYYVTDDSGDTITDDSGTILY